MTLRGYRIESGLDYIRDLCWRQSFEQPMRRRSTRYRPIAVAVIQTNPLPPSRLRSRSRRDTRVEEVQWQLCGSSTEPAKLRFYLSALKCRGCSVWTRRSRRCLLVSRFRLHLLRRPEAPVAEEIDPRTNGATSIPPGWSELLMRPRSSTSPVSVVQSPLAPTRFLLVTTALRVMLLQHAAPLWLWVVVVVPSLMLQLKIMRPPTSQPESGFIRLNWRSCWLPFEVDAVLLWPSFRLLTTVGSKVTSWPSESKNPLVPHHTQWSAKRFLSGSVFLI